jgi:hypothetical protein
MRAHATSAVLGIPGVTSGGRAAQSAYGTGAALVIVKYRHFCHEHSLRLSSSLASDPRWRVAGCTWPVPWGPARTAASWLRSVRRRGPCCGSSTLWLPPTSACTRRAAPGRHR